MPDATAESKPDCTAPEAASTPPGHTVPSAPPPPAAPALKAPSGVDARAALHQNVIKRTPLRAGQFTVGWQIMVAASWIAAFFAFAAVWKTSQEIGIGTWWLGPRAQPQSIAVRVAPSALALVVGVLAMYNIRRTAWISAAASIGIAVGAAFDMSRSGGLAAIEFAIAGSMLLVSIGAVLGAIRTAPVG